MTNILVPTDFTPASLKLAENALKTGRYGRCNLVLFHAFELPSSPFDMLASNHRDPACELVTESFRQACKQLKDENGKLVHKIIVRSLIGNTPAVFRNFVEANDIDLIYCPDTYAFTPVHPRSIDPCYLFRKSGVPVVKQAAPKKEPVYAPSFFETMQVSTQ